MNPDYESKKLLNEYLLFHYGSAELLDPLHHFNPAHFDFPIRTIKELISLPKTAVARALDLGCAVGRSSFELAQYAEQVTAIDYSHSFITAAKHLQNNHNIEIQIQQEAHLYSTNSLNLPKSYTNFNIDFQQGDAMNLPVQLGSFDIVHAANLLCRLSDPILLIQRLHQLVNSNGQLLLTTPCTWLEQYTPSSRWPTPDTPTWLSQLLEPHFTLELETKLPFIIRETANKYQYTFAWATRWLRRS
jgi:putative 4-mercaptohistidine N1-methyltranferase